MWFHDTREEGGPFEFHADPVVSESLVFTPQSDLAALAQAGAQAATHETKTRRIWV